MEKQEFYDYYVIVKTTRQKRYGKERFEEKNLGYLASKEEAQSAAKYLKKGFNVFDHKEFVEIRPTKLNDEEIIQLRKREKLFDKAADFANVENLRELSRYESRQKELFEDEEDEDEIE